MTTSAWIMMLATWIIVTFQAGRFFYKVLTTKSKGGLATYAEDPNQEDPTQPF